MWSRPGRICAIAILLGTGSSLAGCSLIPVPLEAREISDRATADRHAVTQGQEPVTGPISLYEAIARALKYNLDLRLELTQRTLAETRLDLSRYELLPQAVAGSAFNSRDKFSGSSSRSLLTGIQSLESSTSSDRDIATADLNLSWTVLDFGLSYVRAQQAADRVLQAEEEKRKVVNRIVQDVSTAYWRAVSNDRLIARLGDLLNRVNQALRQSQEVESRKLERPLTALTYQRELVGIKRELQELQRDLAFAKVQLAALMNIPPGQEFEIEIPSRGRNDRSIDISPAMLEQLALENRPELRNVAYDQRINRKEATTALLSLLPGVDFSLGKSYSSNSFLFNKNWLAYGAQVSWNLFNVFKLPATRRAVAAQDEVLMAQRLALSMAILTQVYVSLVQNAHASQEYMTASEYFDTQVKIVDQLQSGVEAKAVTEQSLIREEMNMLLADVKYDIARADVENAYAGLFAAIGVDPVPGGVISGEVEDLASTLRQHFEHLSLRDQLYSLKVGGVN